MDQTEEVTAEYQTEQIKQQAAALPTPESPSQQADSKSWIPLAAGLITLAVMTAIAFRFWLAL